MTKPFWTKHDFDALSDPGVERLIAKYGLEGYGRYWAIVEMLGREDGHKLRLNGDNIDVIAHRLRMDQEDIGDFFYFCTENCKLFRMQKGYLWSPRLLKEMSKVSDISAKRSAAARSRWDANAYANAEQVQSKRNANRVENNKEEEKNPQTPKGAGNKFPAFKDLPVSGGAKVYPDIFMSVWSENRATGPMAAHEDKGRCYKRWRGLSDSVRKEAITKWVEYQKSVEMSGTFTNFITQARWENEIEADQTEVMCPECQGEGSFEVDGARIKCRNCDGGWLR